MSYHLFTFLEILSVYDLLQNFDIISKLPEEVALIIFKMLDENSLVVASQVSQRWNDIIMSNRKLKATLKSSIKRIKKNKENSTISVPKTTFSKKRKRQPTDNGTQKNKKRNLRF
ncbi:hypothetical protein O3M35_009316 [Rhynocoris fuscipes]|uniref:F-box domain-containing protein n=1 Tax=Rhynocoris fuscipes TaxID=488301 RepID=A0AAW1D2I0_9HEMI